MNHSTPGLPVHHQLLEFTQTRVHRAIHINYTLDEISQRETDKYCLISLNCGIYLLFSPSCVGVSLQCTKQWSNTYIQIKEIFPLLRFGEVILASTCVLSRVQLFATPWTAACRAPLSMKIARQRILEQVAISFSRASSWPRDRTCVSCIGRRNSLPLGHLG